MMVSDEEKRWLVVGIAMNKVAASVLRDFVKQQMDTHYANNTYCHGLTAPCPLNTLTYHHVNADPDLKRLKFQNINNNLHNHGNRKNLYNYNINSSVDLAKIFLPDYLAEFSAFDESLDVSAILRLLGFNNPLPIFPSPNPLVSIQTSADNVRENVRNKWGHCNVTDWTEVLFNDCFSKLETLVRSLGLTGGMEKSTLDQLSDWKTKGCQLCMGHAVDQNLLSLVQQDVTELIKNYRKPEGILVQQRTEQIEMKNTVSCLQDQQSLTRDQLEEHDEQLVAVLEWKEQQMKENEKVLEKLLLVEKTLSEELLIRVQGVEDDISGVKDDLIGVKDGISGVKDDVRGVKAHISQTDERVKQLEENVRDRTMKDDRPENSAAEPFDVKTCRSKLVEHYKRTATVPTSVWSKASPVDIHQIYTRLSWVKEEQTPAGTSQSELKHYTDVFTANKNGVVPKRILVQGQTGIGKSTFVKKLAVDWAELEDEKTGDKQKDALQWFENEDDMVDDKEETIADDKDTSSEDDEDTSSDEYEDTTSDDEYENQKAALKNFELVLVINLKEVSKCPSLRDVISRCNIFPEEETALVEGLLNYITKNQEKVLLVFDGYDEYRCGRKSDIYEIFRGKKLRNCRVLITTRISKADELREFKDLHAEITGFSEKDRKAFMRRMLGGEAEVKTLSQHLSRKNLTDLTRVPLLLLFFCTLWKKGKLESIPKRKTKLYLAIVQYVLDYSQGKHSPSRFGKVEDFNEILSEIGKVALECLLKDDHVFEYDQLSTAILGDESLIIGLLQVTEYAENLRPAGMVSFIHKSIQEFLAAWYTTYRCVPEGNLGGIEQHARTLKDCLALENVFPFICGLSDDGAVKVFQHLTSVRISDPTLDLSKIIPDVENETDVPLFDFSDKHGRFSNLVYDSFQEVYSKAELLTHFLDCTGRIILVTRSRPLSELIPKVNILTEPAQNCVFLFHSIPFDEDAGMYKSLKFLNCLQMPLTLPESFKVLTFGDLVREVPKSHTGYSRCSFSSILCFRHGQFQFYITELSLECDDHARLFTESTTDSVPSSAECLNSKQSCLKFLSSLHCNELSGQTVKALGAFIRNCKHLTRIQVQKSDDSVCDLLEQVPNPSKCILTIGYDKCYSFPDVHLTSAGAVQLARLLPRFNNIITLVLELINCCSQAVDTLVTSITHKTLKRLVLNEISLTPAAAILGRSLPEMSSLKVLRLTGVDGSIFESKEMEALFRGFNKTLPKLYSLTFSGFGMRGCLAPLTKSFCFFPNLREFTIEGIRQEVNMDEQNVCLLLESLRFIPNLKTLSIKGKPVSQAHYCTAEENQIASVTHKTLEKLHLDGISLTPAVAAALGGSLPEMTSLKELQLTGVDGSILEAKEIEALFGGFNKTLPLKELTFSGFNVRGCLAPLTKSFRFFPHLTELNLGGFNGEFNMDEQNLCLLLESLRFIPNLKTLGVRGKSLSQAHCCTAEISPIVSVTHKTLEQLHLDGRILSTAVAAALGRSLPEMSSLEELELTGVDGSILEAKEMEALFGGFNKTLPLSELTFSGFSLRGCLARLTKSVHFFPNLRELKLGGLKGEFNMDEQNLCLLLECSRFIPNLKTLSVKGKLLRQAHCCTAEVNPIASVTHKTLEQLSLDGISLTPAVAAVLGRLLPEMPSLRVLELTGVDGSILEAKEMEALFGGFNETLPKLYNLTFSGFGVRGCLASLTKSFCFFPSLRKLDLGRLDMNEHDVCSLLESLRFIPKLEALRVRAEHLIQEHCYTTESCTYGSFSHRVHDKPIVDGISLTPAAAKALGQSLSEVSFLQELELTGVRGSILQAEKTWKLFKEFSKTMPLRRLTFSDFSV
ncbi:hypothetical protein ACROYT_G017086 [Oculina patagonica]